MPVPPDDTGLMSLLIEWLWIPFLGLITKVLFDESRFKDLKTERDQINTRQNKRITELEKDVAALDSTTVSENSVRSIIKETMEPFFIDQRETREDIKAISENLTKLRIDVAGENASRRK